MIGYTCKYTPLEFLAAYGGETGLLNREAPDFEYAEGLTHNHFCCHAKAVLEESRTRDLEGLVLVNCCDSLRRAYDVAGEGPGFRFLLDLPHHDGGCARARLRAELDRLGRAYGAFAGTAFDPAKFRAAFAPAPELPRGPFLAVLGARAGEGLLAALRGRSPLPVADFTCGGHRTLPPPPEELGGDVDTLMDWYAGALLGQPPCMRMDEIGRRAELLDHPNLKGIIYHTVKFCDYYGFEYETLRKSCPLPILKLESDFSPAAAGQLATRLDAFAEQIAPGAAPAVLRGRGKGYVAGIDSGSTTTNAAVLDLEGNLVASAIVRTGPKASAGAEKAFAALGGFTPGDMAAVVATGYGRSSIPFATGAVTEITCHARGAHHLNPAARTIVDIGGQDSKVICLDESGAVSNFVMNDKCAAGTGRFLELMARTLEVELADLGILGLRWKTDLTISSICTVFAESEVVSLIADNHSAADIIHGLHKSVAAKTAALAKRAGGTAPYMMTGGVARNRGVVQALEERLEAPLWIPETPDLCGALGAALFALDGVNRGPV